MKSASMSLCGWMLAAAACGAEIPANTWVRLADCPGDAEGREVPPGRASTWAYCPPLASFLRYGGYTPRFSNALDAFDPTSLKWTRLVAEDENYPADRPAGVCEALVVWDESRKCLWIAGGMSTAPSGERGIWRYDPAKRTFAKEAPMIGGGRMAFDAKQGVFVAAPTAYGNGDKGITHVYALAAGKWERKATNLLPQECYRGNFRMTWDEASGKIIAVGAIKDTFEAWAFDTATSTWEVIPATGGPPSRAVCALAYDPGAKQVMLFGGSDGQYGEYMDGNQGRVWNDTWYLDVAAKKWTEVKTPGPTPLTSMRRKLTVELTYRLGLAWNPQAKCMALMDPDLGVWQFRYDPKAEAGKDCVTGGFIPVVGAAAKNPPAKGPPEIRRTFPSALNPRLVDLPDNTLIPLKGGLQGDEIPWSYDKDAGVFLKYGGCGNGSSPYWTHYGNDLAIYDPGTESVLHRRVGDVTGQARPGNGCTRVVTYDAKRKVSWFFGGAASGPYAAPPPGLPGGYFTYDLPKDQFTLVPVTGSGANQNCYMIWSPDHDLAIHPVDKATQVFEFTAAAWTTRPSVDCPGPMYVYQRLAYVASKKAFLRIADGPTGKTSVEKPADALPATEAAGKAETFWRQDKAKLWHEHALRTCLYDPSTNTWTDLKPPKSPPFRTSKYGLVYDSKNDVVILVGGDIDWNGPSCNDMWAYSVAKNTWTRIEPQYAAESKERVKFMEAMMADYDSRHNVVIFRSARTIWAYRYRK